MRGSRHIHHQKPYFLISVYMRFAHSDELIERRGRSESAKNSAIQEDGLLAVSFVSFETWEPLRVQVSVGADVVA